MLFMGYSEAVTGCSIVLNLLSTYIKTKPAVRLANIYLDDKNENDLSVKVSYPVISKFSHIVSGDPRNLPGIRSSSSLCPKESRSRNTNGTHAPTSDAARCSHLLEV